MFVDRVTIEVQGGKGGNGCMKFVKYIPHGGPDGGDGGAGGSVLIVAKNGVNNLASLAHHRFWRAPLEQPGAGPTSKGSTPRISSLRCHRARSLSMPKSNSRLRI